MDWTKTAGWCCECLCELVVTGSQRYERGAHNPPKKFGFLSFLSTAFFVIVQLDFHSYPHIHLARSTTFAESLHCDLPALVTPVRTTEPSDSEESVADSDFASSSIAGSHMDTDPGGPMFSISSHIRKSPFSIDPVATFAALDDPEVTAVARSLNPKKYVGYVRNVHIEYFRINLVMIN
jgi:hypothetical protein